MARRFFTLTAVVMGFAVLAVRALTPVQVAVESSKLLLRHDRIVV